MDVETRITNAMEKRDGSITETELNRYVTRISKTVRDVALKSLQKSGIIRVFKEINLDKPGTNPTIYSFA